MRRNTVDLGFAVAILEPEQSCANMDGKRWELTILAPDRIMEGAKSIHVSDSGVRTLRDFLNERLPVKSGGSVVRDGEKGYFLTIAEHKMLMGKVADHERMIKEWFGEEGPPMIPPGSAPSCRITPEHHYQELSFKAAAWDRAVRNATHIVASQGDVALGGRTYDRLWSFVCDLARGTV